MPKNILIDLNVILDVLLERKSFEASLGILRLSERDAYQLYISAHSHYICLPTRKRKNFPVRYYPTH
ncbi:MAG TPA: PIN domain-containing protein [Candidatus Limnocylindria bacterium]|nr:PIN domain-containing protein [Candidatus Limnocylindria bacterium]